MPFFFVLPSQNRISIARGLAALRSQPPWPCARASPPHSLPAVELRPSPRDSSASSPGSVDRAAARRISLGGRVPGWRSSASSPTPAVGNDWCLVLEERWIWVAAVIYS